MKNNFYVYSGIDVIPITRISKAIARSDNFKFGIFSEEEIDYCESKKHPCQHFAGRWCVKESFLKVRYKIGLEEGISLNKITIENNNGVPKLTMDEEVSRPFEQLLPGESPVYDLSVSISHDMLNNIACGSCSVVSSI